MKRAEVYYRVATDEDAQRVSAVLDALGYLPIREIEHGADRVSWAVDVLSRRYKLTLRESEVLERILAGQSGAEIGAALEVCRATVKWHTHNMFAKTNTHNREGLLRLAWQVSAGAGTCEQPMQVEAEATSKQDSESKPWF